MRLIFMAAARRLPVSCACVRSDPDLYVTGLCGQWAPRPSRSWSSRSGALAPPRQRAPELVEPIVPNLRLLPAPAAVAGASEACRAPDPLLLH